MGANDRSFRYVVGEWGRKARKYCNDIRRFYIKEETQEIFEEECPEPLKKEYEPVADEFYDNDPENYEYYEYSLKLQINNLKQEVRELKRDLKNAKLETKKWEKRWWEEVNRNMRGR